VGHVVDAGIDRAGWADGINITGEQDFGDDVLLEAVGLGEI
jgi:hypothetical protein